MSEENEFSQIFAAYYSGSQMFPFQPITTNSGKNRYVGYFQSGSMDKWIFIYDPEFGGGVLTGHDIGWEIIPLGNGDVPVNSGVSLRSEEENWLSACWSASSWLRDGDESGVPKNVMSLGIAALYWGIPESTLKRHASENKLRARKMGNVWITTTEGMTESYGLPKKSKPNIRQIGEESDRLQKQDTEEIRRKLAEG